MLYRGGAHYFCLELLLRGTFVCNRLDSENWEYESGPQWRPPLDALLARLRALCVADDVATGTGAAGTVGAALPPWPEALEGVDEAKFAEEMARASDGDEPVPESVRRTQREYFVSPAAGARNSRRGFLSLQHPVCRGCFTGGRSGSNIN